MSLLITLQRGTDRLITFRDSPRMVNGATNTEITMVSSKLT